MADTKQYSIILRISQYDLKANGYTGIVFLWLLVNIEQSQPYPSVPIATLRLGTLSRDECEIMRTYSDDERLQVGFRSGRWLLGDSQPNSATASPA